MFSPQRLAGSQAHCRGFAGLYAWAQKRHRRICDLGGAIGKSVRVSL